MDRDKAKALLPVLTALANGETIQANLNGIWVDRTDPAFDLPPECYRIAKPKEKIPLEAEDWIKDGPWWIRSVECPDPFLLINAAHKVDMTCERRNATSDWMPCWKEKE